MSWTQLRITGGDPAVVSAVLFAAGAQALHQQDDALLTSFPDDADVPAVRAALRTAAPEARVEAEALAETDWSLAWREQATVHQVGDLAVAPPWLTAGLDPARTIVIDPGMAFGTGAHASTRGALRLLQQVMRPGIVVADLGSGSAVLAIAAARLGASNVYAIELDPDASRNARENCERNEVAEHVHLFEGDATVLLPLVAPVDLVVANILSSVLVELLPVMRRSLPAGGSVVLAGILAEERDAVLEALVAGGWVSEAEDREEEWWSVAATRR